MNMGKVCLEIGSGNALPWTNACGAGPLVGKVDLRVGEIVKVWGADVHVSRLNMCIVCAYVDVGMCECVREYVYRA